MPLLGQKPVETISEYVEDDTSYKMDKFSWCSPQEYVLHVRPSGLLNCPIKILVVFMVLA